MADIESTVGAIVCVVLALVAGCLIGAGATSHGPCAPLPVGVPAGLAADPVEWSFSPTGGYIHINYKPKEENR